MVINRTQKTADHFCEDTRQSALASLTNLGHVTPFNSLDPSLEIIYGAHKCIYMSP